MAAEVTEVKVTVEAIMEDGGRMINIYSLEPYSFNCTQKRDFRPVHDGPEGEPVSFEVDPDRKGARLTITGVIRDSRGHGQTGGSDGLVR